MSKLTNAEGEVLSSVPSIKGVKPVGTQVLVEKLSAQEITSSTILIDEDATMAGAPQGYVKDLGPKVPEDHGIKVGDRVVLTGNYTPVPDFGNGRPLMLVDPHQIKAILEE